MGVGGDPQHRWKKIALIGGKEGCYFGGRKSGEFLLKCSVFPKGEGEVILGGSGGRVKDLWRFEKAAAGNRKY